MRAFQIAIFKWTLEAHWEQMPVQITVYVPKLDKY